MYNRESFNQASPYEALGTGSGYNLTDDEKRDLPVDTKIALGLWSDALQQSFTNTGDLTEVLMEITQLDRKLFAKGNGLLHEKGYAQLYVDPENPQELRLLLTQKGIAFLEQELS